MPSDARTHFEDLASQRGNTRPGTDARFMMSQPLFDFVKPAPEVSRNDLKADPAEKTNLIDQKTEVVRKLQADLRQWHDSVLRSPTGADDRDSE